MNIVEQKKLLRTTMLERRNGIDLKTKVQYDKAICSALLTLVQERQYRTLHVYLPMKGEINISPFIAEALKNNCTVVAPKTLSKSRLQNLVLTSLKEVEPGVFGTYHPSSGKEFHGNYDLIVVPGLAFDRNNYRLGYGGGYYDKFLASSSSAKKVGIFYPFQEVDIVPKEPHDVQLDTILVDTL